MNLKLYNSKIHMKSNSAISGQVDTYIEHEDDLFKIPILREFLADDEIQEIVICSTNIGFVKTFTKSYRKQ